MSPQRPWLPYIALACACFVAAVAFWPLRAVSDALVIGGVLATIGGGLHGLRMRRDPYDLRTLREVEEREELRNLDVPSADDIDQVQCLCCQRVYAARFPTCPHCAEKRR